MRHTSATNVSHESGTPSACERMERIFQPTCSYHCKPHTWTSHNYDVCLSSSHQRKQRKNSEHNKQKQLPQTQTTHRRPSEMVGPRSNDSLLAGNSKNGLRCKFYRPFDSRERLLWLLIQNKSAQSDARRPVPRRGIVGVLFLFACGVEHQECAHTWVRGVDDENVEGEASVFVVANNTVDNCAGETLRFWFGNDGYQHDPPTSEKLQSKKRIQQRSPQEEALLDITQFEMTQQMTKDVFECPACQKCPISHTKNFGGGLVFDNFHSWFWRLALRRS